MKLIDLLLVASVTCLSLAISTVTVTGALVAAALWLAVLWYFLGEDEG